MTPEITGRDAYIEAQALYQACRYQQSLKDEGSMAYEWSNHQDMKAILSERHPVLAAVFQEQDKERGVDPLDLTDEKRAA